MALDISPPNLGGLTAVAGQNGNLNLTVPGALGLQSLQIRNTQDASLRQAAFDRMQLQQQGGLALGQQQIQRAQLAQQGLLAGQANTLDQQRLAAEQQKTAMLGSQFEVSQNFNERDLAQKGALGFGALDAEKQRNEAENQAKMIAKMMDMDSKKVNEKGAFASYALVAMKNAKTPEESQQIRGEIIKDAVASGHMTKDQASEYTKMPISQFNNTLMSQVFALGNVKDFKAMMDATEDKTDNKRGTTEVVLPDGTRVTSSALTTPVKSEAQKELIFAEDNITELKKLYGSVEDKHFGAAATGQWGTIAQEWAENIPGVGPTKEAKDSLEKYSGIQSQSEMLAMNVIKQLSGLSYTDKQLEFLKNIVPAIGPGTIRSVFEGKSKNLIRFFDQIKRDRQELLKQGLEVGSPEYEKQMLNKMKEAVAPPKTNVSGGSSLDARRQHLRDTKRYTEAEINDYLEGK